MAKRKTSRRKRKSRKSPGAGILSLVISGFSLLCIVLSLSGEGAAYGFVGDLGAKWGEALLWLFGYPALALCLIGGYFGVELLRGSRQ
ncbi:hypothetical protein K8R78_01365, partial [bacterium]|nr:hypothetical protein [bacterium]